MMGVEVPMSSAHTEGAKDNPVPESAGFESFFEANRARVFGAMCLVTGNRQEAEEIAQDAFLRLWERWDKVSKLEDPTGYLFRTAMNVFRNRVRRAAIAVRKSLGLVDRADELAAVEDRDDMIRAIRDLTPHQRAALVLTGYLGYSSDEAAKILGVRASTVRALATKGRATARATVEGWR
jgi:RNA polymerase sigma-70 factor (ECF subfamily)